MDEKTKDAILQKVILISGLIHKRGTFFVSQDSYGYDRMNLLVERYLDELVNIIRKET